MSKKNITRTSRTGTEWKLTPAGVLWRGEDRQGKAVDPVAAAKAIRHDGWAKVYLTDGTHRMMAPAKGSLTFDRPVMTAALQS